MKISEILNKYDTDKNRNQKKAHCYGRAYDHLFSTFDREAELDIVEIGTYYGESLRAWKEFFPNANITGIDIKDFVKKKQDGISYVICDVKEYKPKQEYDIVIDDGSHALSDILFTVKDFKLKEGGIMVIEDSRNPSRWSKEIRLNSQYPVEFIDLRKINGQFDDALIVMRNYGYNL